MRNVARNVWQITGFPANAINAYLTGDVLIDCGLRWDRRRFFRALHGVDLKMVALTHCHPDHQGVAKAICEKFNCPLACHEADKPAMEGLEPMGPPTRAIRISSNLLAGPPRRVDRTLREGDEVGGFRVYETPGHTMGHLIYFREEDGVAIAGDLLVNMNFLTFKTGLHEPPGFFSIDRMMNRESVRKLVDLKPSKVLWGHGPPLNDFAKLHKFVRRLI